MEGMKEEEEMVGEKEKEGGGGSYGVGELGMGLPVGRHPAAEVKPTFQDR